MISMSFRKVCDQRELVHTTVSGYSQDLEGHPGKDKEIKRNFDGHNDVATLRPTQVGFLLKTIVLCMSAS